MINIKKIIYFSFVAFLFLFNFGITCFASTNKLFLPIVSQYYPIYNRGDNFQTPWMAPNSNPAPPFNKTNLIIVAFAHVYNINNQATLSYENQRGLDQNGNPIPPAEGDTDHDRILQIIKYNNEANPLGNVKVIISIGDNDADCKKIYDDFINGSNNFPKSVVAFIKENNLDGIDLDFEGNPPSGSTTEKWTTIFSNIKSALTQLSKETGKEYLMTITLDSSYIGYITNENKNYFDLINLMTYWSRISVSNGQVNCSLLDDISAVDPNLLQKTTVGLDSETKDDVNTRVQVYKIDKLAGIFNWEWAADQSSDFTTTNQMWDQMMSGA